MKKWIGLFLVFTLLFSLTVPAFGAETAKGTTLRLTATEGTVTLHNQNGRSLTVREDMKLYSGYTITTSASSYAYISLDDTKAVKLDASTTAEIRKSGKKLQVLVSSGKLFFNVTAPLKEDESLEIRTSTIVTGIRGTSGVMDCASPEQTTLYLTDGHVTMQVLDPQTGKAAAVPISAGQAATVAATAQGGASPTVALRPLEAAAVPAFAAVEIAKSPQLQEKIAQQSKLDVSALVNNASQALAKEQALAQQQQAQVEKEKASQEKPSAPESVFPSPPAGDNSGTAPTPPEPTPPEPTPPEPDRLGGAVTPTQLTAALAQHATVTLDGTAVLSLGANALTVAAGKTLVLESGASLSLASGGSLAVQGSLSNGGSVTNGGSVSVAGTVRSSGTFSNSGTMEISGSGSFTNSGSFAMSGGLVERKDSTDPVLASSPGGISFTGGYFRSALSDSVIPDAFFAAPTTDFVRGSQGSSYVLGIGMQQLIAAVGSTATTIPIQKSLTAATPLSIVENQSITLHFQNANSCLNLENAIRNAGTLTLTASAFPSAAFHLEAPKSGDDAGTAIVNSGTLLVNAKIHTLTGAGSTVVNTGAITVGASAIISGESCGIENKIGGTVMVNTGSVVTSPNYAIRNHSDNVSDTVRISGGTVELVQDKAGQFAIEGAFSLSNNALVQAKQAAQICNKLPAGYATSATATNGWYSLVPEPATP